MAVSLAGCSSAPDDPPQPPPVYAPPLLEAVSKAADVSDVSQPPGKPIDPAAWTRRQVTVSSSVPRQATYRVTLDGRAQVLRLDVPVEISEDTTTVIYPSLTRLPETYLGRLTPAAALGLKAKQFDDGLYAAAEYAVTAGSGRVMARAELLRKVAAALPTSAPAGAGALLVAASSLGAHPLTAGAPVQAAARSLQEEFLADEKRSKPLGFYTWNEDLARVFRRDRMLQTPLPTAVALALTQAVRADVEARRGYEAALQLNERLTNPLSRPDLRPALTDLDAGRTPAFDPNRQAAFLPASASRETELVERLFGTQPVPEGFNLADEMVRRIRSGQLDLTPREASGWYDHQSYSLEPLVVPDKMPEGKRLELTDSYRAELVGLFKALLALTRETHVKQLDLGLATARAPGAVDLAIGPGLTVEPTATYFRRRAESYLFVRRVLEEAFGAGALATMHRRTANGLVSLTLEDELSLIEGLMIGAYFSSCRELGLAPTEVPGSRWAGRPDAAVSAFDAWAAALGADPDLGQDLRMMVPVFYDAQRRMTKVWAVLGVATKRLEARFAVPPAIESVRDEKGQDVPLTSIAVSFIEETYQLPYLVTAEVYVGRLLDREEFRRHCDRYKAFQAIVDHLK